MVVCLQGMLDGHGAFRSEKSIRTCIQRAFEASTFTGKPRQDAFAAMHVVTDAAFLKKQSQGVRDRVGKGGEFLGVKRSWDETACRMYSPNIPHLGKLITRLNIPESCLKIFDR